MADLLAHVKLKRVFKDRAEQRRHALRNRGEPLSHLQLRVALLGKDPDTQPAIGGGKLGHRHADHARDLKHLVLGDADIAELLHLLRRLDVALGEQLLVALGFRHSQCAPVPAQELHGHARFLGDLLLLKPWTVAHKRPLERQEDKPPLLNRVTKLLETHAGLAELVEKLTAPLAGLALRALKEALGFPVDAHRARILADRRIVGAIVSPGLQFQGRG